VIEVSNNGVDFTNDRVATLLTPLPAVHAVEPTRGALRGGTIVTVIGTGFVDSNSLLCRFGSAADSFTAASFINSTVVLCMSPPATATVSASALLLDRTVSLFITNDARAFSLATVTFTYHNAPEVTSVYPDHGDVTGGTLITVLGIHFLFDGSNATAPEFRCRFSADGDTELVSPSSNATALALADPGVSAALAADVDASVVVCASPPRLAGSVWLDVGAAGADYSASGVRFTYTDAGVPAITSVSPPFGSVLGNTTFVVRGTGFVNSDDAQCRFGSEVVVARFLSATAVVCVTPVVSPPALNRTLGAVAVDVTMNGGDWTAATNSAVFTFRQHATLLRATPTVISSLGTAQISVAGVNLHADMDFACAFGTYGTLAAVFVNATMLTCVAPPMEGSSVVTLTVISRIDPSLFLSLPLTVDSPLSVTSIQPRGTSVLGGTVLTLTGAGFYNATASRPAISCVFNETSVVPATFVSSTRMLCVALASGGVSTASVRLTNVDEAFRSPTDELSIAAESNWNTISYFWPPSLLSVAPSLLPLRLDRGDHRVLHVTGEDFYASELLSCRFTGVNVNVSSIVITAVHRSATSLLCVAPPALVAGNYSLRVSNDRLHFSASELFVSYVDAFPLMLVTPDAITAGAPVNISLSGDFDDVADAVWTCSFRYDAVTPPVGTIAESEGSMFVRTQSSLAVRVHATLLTCSVPPPDFVVAEFEYTLHVGASNGRLISNRTIAIAVYSRPADVNIVPFMRPFGNGSYVDVSRSGIGPFAFCHYWPSLSLTSAEAMADPQSVQCLQPENALNATISVSVSRLTLLNLLDPGDFGHAATYAPESVDSVVATQNSDAEFSVLVSGSNFLDSAYLSCMLSDVPISARFLSSSLIACVFPVDLLLSNAALPLNTLHVSNNGFDYVLASSAIAPALPTRVKALLREHFTTLPLLQESVVAQLDVANTVGGTNGLRCRFGDRTVLASLVDGELRCVLPPAMRLSALVARQTGGGDQMFSVRASGDALNFVPLGSAAPNMTFHEIPYLSSLSPVHGSVAGNATIDVVGTGFIHAITMCRFDMLHESKAVVTASTRAQCRTPAHVAGAVLVDLVNRYDDYTDANAVISGLVYTYMQTNVSAISPSCGAEVGGTVVSLTGADFVRSDALFVEFVSFVAGVDSFVVAATYVSQTLLTFTTPPMPAGNATVALFIDGARIDGSALSFEFIPSINLASITPASGSTYGHILVALFIAAPPTLMATLARNNLALQCAFDVFLTSPVSVALDTCASGTACANQGVVSCTAPFHSVGTVLVALRVARLDGAIISATRGLVYTYHEPTRIVSFAPVVGPSKASTTISIDVRNLSAAAILADALFCVFNGNHTFPATIVNSTRVQCSTPLSPSVHSVTPVSVAVANNNNGGLAPAPVQFTYYPAARADALLPLIGQRGTIIVVTGANFAPLPSLSCRFGTTVVRARWLSATRLECVVPERQSPHLDTAVDISNHGLSFSAPLSFRYSEFGVSLSGTTALPPSGPSAGGTLVAVTGKGFVAGADLVCVFDGDIRVAATLNATDSNTISCETPPHSAGTVGVNVDMVKDGFLFSSSRAVLFEYYADVVLTGADVNRTCDSRDDVALNDCAVIVGVDGSTFSAVASCEFTLNMTDSSAFKHTAVTAALMVTPSRIECVLPPALLDAVRNDTTISDVLQIGVRVSNNQQQFSDQTLVVSLKQWRPLILTTFSVVHVATNARNVEVFAHGSAFTDSPTLLCRFSSNPTAPVRAQWLSSTMVSCPVPDFVDSSSGEVTLSISVDGSNFVAFSSKLVFHNPISGLSHVTPSAISTRSDLLRITVHGYRFVALAGDVLCRFNDLVVPGVLVNSTIVECPLLLASLSRDSIVDGGTLSVAVSMDGFEFSDSLPIALYAPAFVSSIYPTVCSVSGGTLLAVAGERFAAGARCVFSVFGADTSNALSATMTTTTFHSSTRVECPSPASNRTSGLMVRVHVCNDEVSCDVPTAFGFAHLLLAPVVYVGSLHPDVGHSGDLIRISGAGFFNTASLTCRFGFTLPAPSTPDQFVSTTSGIYHSSTAVSCVAPVRTDRRAAIVFVDVSNDNFTFTRANNTFLYADPLLLHSIEPSIVSTAAPTSLTLHGTLLTSPRATTPYCVFGGSVRVLAIAHGSGTVVCDSPVPPPLAGTNLASGASANHVPVHVMLDDKLVSTVQYIEYVAAPYVTRVHPPYALSTGVSVITLIGGNFIDREPPPLRFRLVDPATANSTIISSYTFLNDSAVSIVVLSMSASAIFVKRDIRVSASLHMLDFSAPLSVGATLSIVPPITLDHLHPTSGPVFGGSWLRLHLVNDTLLDLNALRCRFSGRDSVLDQQETQAFYYNVSMVECETPPHDVGTVDVDVVFPGGVVYSTNQLPFAFRQPTVFFAIAESHGSDRIYDNALVYVYGTNVHDDTTSLHCNFTHNGGSVLVLARWLTTTTLECVAPALSFASPSAVTVFFSWVADRDTFLAANEVDMTSTISAEFTYQPLATVLSSSVGPLMGSVIGGTTIFIGGSNMWSTPFLSPIQCVFHCSEVGNFTGTLADSHTGADIATVVASVVTPSNALCATPAYALAGIYTLEVVDTSQGRLLSTHMFTYYNDTQAVFISPRATACQGNVLVTARGTGFVNSPLLRCHFSHSPAGSGVSDGDGFLVRARWISEHEVQCEAPACHLSPQLAQSFVRVSNNAQDWTVPTAETVFHYLPPSSLSSLEPATGLAHVAHEVRLHGRGFRNVSLTAHGGAPLYCRIAWDKYDATDPLAPLPPLYAIATYLNSSTLSCELPPLSGNVRVELVDLAADRSVVPVIRANLSTIDHLAFAYTMPARMLSFAPSLGSMAGSTLVNITGFNLVAPILCRFGNETVVGTVLSPTLAQCLSPPQLVVSSLRRRLLQTGGGGGDAGATSFSVSVGGSSTFSVLGSQFTYFNPIEVDVIYPAGLVGVRSTIYVRGANFVNTFSLSCRLGGRFTVSAVWMTSQLLMCSSTLLDATRSDFSAFVGPALFVEVSNNAVDFVGANVTVNFGATAHASVQLLSPTIGSTRGGTLINIFGSNFVNTTEIVCRFGGSTLRAAMFVTTSHLSCMTPDWSQLEKVTVDVSFNNGFDFDLDTSNSVPLMFEYFLPPEIASLYPSFGNAAGGSDVLVTGANFQAAAVCRFDELTEVKAVFLSAESVVCRTPPHNVTSADGVRVVIEVSNNGVYSPSFTRAMYTYRNDPVITGMSPASGLSSGGTRVVLEGSNFLNSLSLVCRFGLIVVDSTFEGPTTLVCESPPHSPGDVTVEVSNNGVDYTSHGFMFNFIPADGGVAVTSIVPNRGGVSGGTPVLVTGTGFTGDEVYCLFGTVSVMGVQQTPVKALCISPPGRNGDSVDLEVTILRNNTITKTSTNGVKFKYEGPEVFSILPTSGSAGGGTRVVLSGASFSDSYTLICWFNVDSSIASEQQAAVTLHAASAPASFINATAIECITPTYNRTIMSQIVTDEHAVVVRVGYNSIDLAPSFVSFQYAFMPNVTSISPKWGGSTRVYIAGEYFVNSLNLACRFGTLVVPAVFVSGQLVSCTAPLQAPGAVAVSVTNNAVEFSPEGVYYVYQTNPNVVSIVPVFGPIGGDTRVLVAGKNFINATDMICQFGSTVVAAEFISSRQLACVSPPGDFLGSVAVEVSTNYQNLTSNNVQYQYIAPVLVLLVEPPLGYTNRSTEVTIAGDFYFGPDIPIKCLFGDVAVPALWLDDRSVNCTAPPQAVGIVDVRIMPFDYIGSGVVFLYTALPQLTSATPALAFMSDGTSMIQIVGRNFFDNANSHLYCLFGDRTDPVQAEWASSTLIWCRAPVSSTPGVVQLRVVLDPANIDATTFAGNSLDFLYEPDIALFTLSPTSGLATLSTPVFVYGSPFINSTLLLCQIGLGHIVPAIYVSRRVLICVLPPRYASSKLDAEYVDIRVTGNGVDYNLAPLIFRYRDAADCPASSYCPVENGVVSGVQHLCPPGTMCPGTGNDAFTLCPRGTYQPNAGQVKCLSCPPPFFCPSAGLRSPLLCSAGTVCSKARSVFLTGAPCPAGYVCDQAGLISASAGPTASATSRVAESSKWLVLSGSFRDALAKGTPQASSMQACPAGVFCPPGTRSARVISPGNFVSNPQPCFPAHRCGNSTTRPEGDVTCPPGMFCPTSGVSYRCIPGYFCPGGNTQPVICTSGTYNPFFGQFKCLPCPIGFTCPARGIFAPRVCRGGYVCDEENLANEVKPCPAGHYCGEGTVTADPSSYSLLRPIPCPAGVFCLPGVLSNSTREGNFNFPQPCIPGQYCQAGATSAKGTGACPQGYYCPGGTIEPIRASIGSFNAEIAQFRSTECFPGKFAPVTTSQRCQACPAGYTCQDFGTVVPNICPRGSFRSLNDSITCKSCPPGRWSGVRGLSDIDFCLPCPPGNVCLGGGQARMDQAAACFEGYVCGENTYSFSQFDVECANGYACPPSTTPATRFSTVCPAGYLCDQGTTYQGRTRVPCPQGSYCPRGTWRISSTENVNGTLTVTLGELHVNCRDDDPFVDGDTTEPCGDGSELISLPYGPPYVRPWWQCPKGTRSNLNAVRQEDCFPIVTGEAVFTTNPIRTVSKTKYLESTAPESILVESTDMYSSFRLEPLDYAVFSFDFRSLRPDIVYGEHFVLKFTLKAEDGTRDLHRLPEGFKNSGIDKRGIMEISVFAIQALEFDVSIEIIHGRFLREANQLVRSADVTVKRPYRASTVPLGVFNPHNIFIIIYDAADRGLEVPMNLPRDDEVEMMIGAVTTNTSVPLINDLLSEVEVAAEDVNDAYVLPYLPYFSNCRGFDSHIPFHALLENADDSKCSLEARFDTVPITQTDFTTTPRSDTCEYPIACKYEERLTEKTPLPKWFGDESNGNAMFYIKSKSVGLASWVSQDDLVETFGAELGSDSLIEVAVVRSPDAGANDIPRQISFSIQYHQISIGEKTIIQAEISQGLFDTDATNSNYELIIEFSPLDYFGVINLFAFPANVYAILFVVIGVLNVMITYAIWFIHRIFTRLKYPPKFKFRSYVGLIVPPAIYGLTALLVPLFAVLYVLNFVLVEKQYFDSFDSDMANLGSLAEIILTEDEITLGRSGRIGTCFMSLAMYMMYWGTQLLIPPRRKQTSAPKALSAEEEGDVMVQSGYWRPKDWKRSHFFSASALLAVMFMFVIEFSYADIFGEEIWFIIVGMKFAGIFLEIYLRKQMQEVLLVIPMITAVNIVTFVVTLGADSFTDFVSSYFIEFGMMIVERIHLDSIMDTFIEAFLYITTGVKKFFAKMSAVQDIGGKREKNEIEEEEESILLPLIDNMASYAGDAIALYLSPVVIVMLIVFREPWGIAPEYGIRVVDMFYYLLFALLIIPAQLVIDIIIFNCQELFHGWRIQEHMYFMEYRFRNRTERWVALTPNMDMAVAKEFRSLDHLSFSSQFYFMCGVHAVGILLFAISLETFVRQGFNFFHDLWTPAIIVGMIGLCRGIHHACLALGNLFQLWVIPKKRLTRLDAVDKLAPQWTPKYRKKIGDLRTRLALDGYFNDDDRVDEENFRHRFVFHNKPWIVTQLPAIVGPKNIMKTAGANINRVARSLRRVLQTGLGGDISSSSDEGADNKLTTQKEGLSGAMRKLLREKSPASMRRFGEMARFWLAIVRERRLIAHHLRSVTLPSLNDRDPWCAHCESDKNLGVEPSIAISQLIDDFEDAHSEYRNTTQANRIISNEAKQAALFDFVLDHKLYTTLCRTCVVRLQHEDAGANEMRMRRSSVVAMSAEAAQAAAAAAARQPSPEEANAAVAAAVQAALHAAPPAAAPLPSLPTVPEPPEQKVVRGTVLAPVRHALPVMRADISSEESSDDSTGNARADVRGSGVRTNAVAPPLMALSAPTRTLLRWWIRAAQQQQRTLHQRQQR
jgi:hypothetical protein